MKIGHLENKSVAPTAGERKPGAAVAPSGPGAGGKAVEASAKVELSATVAQLSAGGAEGVFDAQKVQRITTRSVTASFRSTPRPLPTS